MGSFFGNINIENNNNYLLNDISKRIIQILKDDDYVVTDSDEFDREIIIVKNNNWFTIYDSNVDAQDAKELANLVKKISEKLKTKSIGLVIYDSESIVMACSINGDQIGLLSDDNFEGLKKNKPNEDIWAQFFGSDTKKYINLIEKFEEEEVILSKLANYNNLDEDLIFRGYNYYTEEVEKGTYDEINIKFKLITQHPAFEKEDGKPILVNNYEKRLNLKTNLFTNDKNETFGVLQYCLQNQGGSFKGIRLILKGSLIETKAIEIYRLTTKLNESKEPDECTIDGSSIIYTNKNLEVSGGMKNYYNFNQKEDFKFQKKLFEDFRKTVLDVWIYYEIKFRKSGKIVFIIESLETGLELYNYCLNVNEQGEQVFFSRKNKAGLTIVKPDK